QAGHRLRRRRARLPHPRIYRRGRAAGLRRAALPQVHTGGWPTRTAPGGRGQDGAGFRLPGRGRPGAGHQRRQAGRLPDAPLPAPGDGVIVPAPYWTTYPEAIALAGGVMVPVHTDEQTGYLASVEDLEAARTSRSKVLLFVSPSNPTGAVYSPEQVRQIGEWA